ncbi:MAG: iron chelate uptake ABC transporter family permease subunit, partial [Deltaproteobacteria bacterium]|nr:iron chelate uptake ABC transporter family permease subunit [Deltaproteobacteria bacterium]
MQHTPRLAKRMTGITFGLLLLLCAVMALGMSMGSAEISVGKALRSLFGIGNTDPVLASIIWEIRFPRVLLAALLGATLSLGGLVFQALLKNPLAEPYILGISGGSAIGAIIGILMGLSRFPGVGLMAFMGSMITLLVVVLMSTGKTVMKQDALLLSGVMVNAFCSAVIMFLISITQDARL